MRKALLAVVLGVWGAASAAVRPAAVFSDHAVLLRAADTPVFGRADPGEAVRISLGTVRADGVAGQDGTWLVRLDLRNVGEGPFDLEINDRVVRDVLVGEVWLASGQSNMEFSEGSADDAEAACAQTNRMVRCFRVARNIALEPGSDVSGRWHFVSPETTPKMSAVGYQFATRVQAALRRPVGFVVAAVGGSKIEAWCTPETTVDNPRAQAEMDALAAFVQDYRHYETACEAELRGWERSCGRLDRPHGGIPADGWRDVRKPEAESFVHPAGAVWFRRTVVAQRGKGLRVSRKRFIEQQWRFDTSSMEVYWNGRPLVRHFPDDPLDRNTEHFDVAGEAVSATNVLAVRVFNAEEIPNVFYGLHVNGRRLPYGGWSLAEEFRLSPLTGREKATLPARQRFCLPQHYPSGLYNGMVAGLVPMGLSGVIWYQGESNTKRADAYEDLFRSLILSWRRLFGRENLPFAWCQLAGNARKAVRPDRGDTNWQKLRDAQDHVLDLPMTGQAVLIDVGEEEDIHPRDKRTPGRRLANWALNQVYGQKEIPYLGPRFAGVERQGDALVVRFRDSAKGLRAHDLGTNYVVRSRIGKMGTVKRNAPSAEVEGFAVAGADGVWHWADEATIEGACVRVRSRAVPEPVSVRYGWAINPWVNLYNSDGLPAVPFGVRHVASASPFAGVPQTPGRSWKGASLEAWATHVNMCRDVRLTNGVLSAVVTGRDSQFIARFPEPLAISPDQTVRLTLRAQGTGPAQFFWQGADDAAMSRTNCHTFHLGTAGTVQTYAFQPGWLAGRVQALRLDFPPEFKDGVLVEIHGIEIVPGIRSEPIDAARSEWVTFALRMPPGVHYCSMRWNGETQGRGYFGFVPATDGLEHVYAYRLGDYRNEFPGPDQGRVSWKGTIPFFTIGQQASDAVLPARNVTFHPGRPDLPADPVVTAAYPSEAIPRAGRPFPVEIVVRNYGTRPAENLRFAFDGLPPGVKPLNPVELEPGAPLPGTDGRDTIHLKRLPPLASERVYRIWLSDPGVGPHAFGVTLRADGVPPRRTAVKADVKPSLGLPKADYPPEPRKVDTSPYEIGAFIFPVWGEGFPYGWHSAWSHAPWRKPVLGWYDETATETLDWQIKHLAENGISYVLVDWYWSRGKPRQNQWPERFRKARYRKYLKWQVNWCNEAGVRTHTLADHERLTRYWIENFFNDPQYRFVNGMPAVMVFVTRNLEKYQPGVTAKDYLDLSRRLAREAGYKGIWFETSRNTDSEDPARIAFFRTAGVDATSIYRYLGKEVPRVPLSREGNRAYRDLADTSHGHWHTVLKNGGLPILPTLTTGWDNRPWQGDSWNSWAVTGINARDFRRICEDGRRFSDETGLRTLLMGPLDEWGEGEIGYPNAEHGFGFLEAVRDTFGRKPPEGWAVNAAPEDYGRTCPQRPPMTEPATWWFRPDELDGTRHLPAPREVSLGELKWTLPPYARMEGSRLIVDVPESAGPCASMPSAVVDLSPFVGHWLRLEIPIEAAHVPRPEKPYWGVKFQLPVDYADGTRDWPGRCFGEGTWSSVGTFRAHIRKPLRRAKLELGLQSSTGRVVYDLSKLKVWDEGELFKRVNQDFKVKYPESVARRAPMRGVMLATSAREITEDHFATLERWGATLARFQIARGWTTVGAWLDCAAYDRYVDGELDLLERNILPWAARHGIKICLDLHAVPGARINPGKQLRMCYEKKYRDHFVATWRRIATRFRNDPRLYGYDLVNEPNQMGHAPYSYLHVQLDAARAIREVDTQTPIVVEANAYDGAPAFEYLSPLALDNVIYQVHCYLPMEFTHQGVFDAAKRGDFKPYPNEAEGWNKAFIRKTLDPVLRFARRHRAKIYVGEFSAVTWAPGAENYMRDAIEIFNEYGWDWSYHAFREYREWSVEHTWSRDADGRETYTPSLDNPRMRVLTKGFRADVGGKVQEGAAQTVLTAPTAAHAPETRRFTGIPSLAVSPSGRRLWATWYTGSTDGEDSNNYGVLATSVDDGRTWKEVLVADPDGKGPCRAFDCEVWVTPNGKLCWSWTERPTLLRTEDKRTQMPGISFGAHRDVLVRAMLDAEQEPRAPYPPVRRMGSGVMMCKPLVLRSGRWLFPASLWGEDASARVYASDGGGGNFTLLGGATLPKWVREFDEHNLVELADGRLRAYLRALRGPTGCWTSESSDGGRTWTRTRPADFAHTNSRLFVRRLASGRLLLVKNGPLDRDVGRKQLTAFLSDDDGATWKGGLVLEKGSCAYPDGDQAPDGTIYVTYDNDRTKRQDIHLAVFTEADVFAGKPVSEKARLDGLVYRNPGRAKE